MNPVPQESSFPLTQWTVVYKARDENDIEGARKALAKLCNDYWYPLYCFASRTGLSRHDAEDETQGFYAYLLERGLFAEADPDRGRLRSFLLTAFRRYIGDGRAKSHARKRGSGEALISFDADVAHERYLREAASTATPEVSFERSWAHASLRAALARLAGKETEAGSERQFRELRPYLLADASADARYSETALRLEMSEEAVRKAVSRLRRRFREQLRRQIAETLRNPTEAQLEEEMLALKQALRA